jgi:methionyl-tRNA formyltransferase
MARLRLAFMGTPEFARTGLAALIAAGHDIACVYSQPPRPAGRGRRPRPSPVQALAEERGLPVRTPVNLREAAEQTHFAGLGLDAAVVAAYGLILPPAFLEAPRRGCLNIHASLLPRWRGAAPIQRAIMAGDAETGVDLMRMEEGLDTGPIALRHAIAIHPNDTAGDLSRRLAKIAAELAARGLNLVQGGDLEFRDQPSVGVCYAPKIDKHEAEIDWTRSGVDVRNHIHGLSPTPGAFSYLSIEGRLERLKILRAREAAASGPPGTILDREMTVACGEGAVRIIEGQRPGHRILSGPDIIRGERAFAGATFMRAGKSSFVRQGAP